MYCSVQETGHFSDSAPSKVDWTSAGWQWSLHGLVQEFCDDTRHPPGAFVPFLFFFFVAPYSSLLLLCSEGASAYLLSTYPLGGTSLDPRCCVELTSAKKVCGCRR